MENDTNKDEDSKTLINATEAQRKRRSNNTEDKENRTVAWGEIGETEQDHKKRKLFLMDGKPAIIPKAGKQQVETPGGAQHCWHSREC